MSGFSQKGDGVLLLLRGAAGFRAFQVWGRLIQTSLPNLPLHRAIVAESRAAKSILAALPPSERDSVEVWEPSPDLLGRFGGEQVVVGVLRGGEVAYQQAGGPTDAGWDALELAAGGPEGTPTP